MSSGRPPDGVFPARGSLLWTITVRGAAGQNPFFDDLGASLYASDGWGRAPAPTLRFRRYDALTGQERARWPCGSAVRCATVLGDGDLLVATDQRLAQLDATSLAERRRWNRSVKYASTIAVAGSIAVAANWRLPTVTLVDLETGLVRRKRHGEMTTVVGRPGHDPLLVGGASGGLAAIDPISATIRRLRTAPAAHDVALTPDGDALWLTTGIRVVITERPGGASLRPGDATTRLERHPLGEGEATVIDVPLPVRTVACGVDGLWLTPGPVQGSEQFVVVRTNEPADGWRLWPAAVGELVAAVSPTARLVLTSAHRAGDHMTTFRCHRLDWD